jgi:hypothetical protein
VCFRPLPPQLMQQCPTAFEYTPAFVVRIVEAAYSCKTGTFMFDTERERRAEDVVGFSERLLFFLA